MKLVFSTCADIMKDNFGITCRWNPQPSNTLTVLINTAQASGDSGLLINNMHFIGFGVRRERTLTEQKMRGFEFCNICWW